jgi:glutamyl-tRNA reductase
MIGAGKMGALTLRHVLEMGPTRVLVTNRTAQRAESLARQVRGEAVPFEALEAHLVASDIVISCTGADEPVITAERFRAVHRRRRSRPLFLIDIAVPRDIDPAIGEADNVYLYNIDDLQTMVEATLDQRKAELDRCHEILEQHLQEFLVWQTRRDIGPLIAALDGRIDEINRGELEWLLPKLGDVSQRDRELIAQALHRIKQKILHGPTQTLQTRPSDISLRVYADTIRQIFDLHDEE